MLCFRFFVFLPLVPSKQGEMARTTFFFFAKSPVLYLKQIENILATLRDLLNKCQVARVCRQLEYIDR